MSEEQFDFRTTNVETETVGMERSDIVQALYHDARFFINFYLGEELEFPVPDFHVESWDLLTAMEVQWIALALPRGHAKTTLTRLVVIWYLLYTPTRFIVYVSNTSSPAAESCKAIIDFIESQNHQTVFGRCEFETRQESFGFYKFWMTVPDGKGGFIKKYCILKALGAGQQVRGLNIDNERPQLAIVDDLEDNENTATPLLQKKLKLCFFGAFMKALSRKMPKCIYIGNMLSNQGLLYYMCEKSKTWFTRRFGCLLSSGSPLWPDLWSFDKIREDFLEYQRAGMTALWFAEMMNMPIVDGNSIVDVDKIQYFPLVVPGEHENAFITIDPAYSQESWANDSAIIVHAQVGDRWQIAEVVAGKFRLQELYYILVELSQRWRTRVVGVESGSLQLGLRVIFDLLGKVDAQQFELYDVPHRNRSKTERIAAWCTALEKGVWVLTEGDLVVMQQLVAYDPTKRNNIDDIIDACSMGIMMTQMYMPAIMDAYVSTLIPTRVTNVIGH